MVTTADLKKFGFNAEEVAEQTRGIYIKTGYGGVDHEPRGEHEHHRVAGGKLRAEQPQQRFAQG